jgi:cytochrome c biogenesis protein CcmG/thiol:disulfide interchange protein DsbE
MRLRLIAWVVGGGTAALLLGSLGWGLLNASNKLPPSLLGRSAPDITVATLDGQQLALSAFRGTPVVVNFWASWCVPCRQEAPVLNAAAREYKDRVQFLGVDIQDTDSAARAYQAELMSPYPVGPAIKGSYRAWGVTAPPETFFLDRQGVVVTKIVGPVDGNRLKVYIGLLGP